MRAESLSIGSIPHASELFKDYLLNFSKVSDFFPAPPFAPETIAASAKSLSYPDERRERIAAILEKQNKTWGAGEKTLANLEKFRGGAHAVVTGHQVSL